MEFSLLNHENQTNFILKELEGFGFSKIKITRKEQLSFVEINDNRFSSCITRIVCNLEYQMCLHIYKMFEYGKSIDIPIKIIQTIDRLEME